MDTLVEEVKKILYKEALPLLISAITKEFIAAITSTNTNNSGVSQNRIELIGDRTKITRVVFHGPIFVGMNSDALNKIANATINAYMVR